MTLIFLSFTCISEMLTIHIEITVTFPGSFFFCFCKLYLIFLNSSTYRKSRFCSIVHFFSTFFCFLTPSKSLKLIWQLTSSRLSKCLIVDVPILLLSTWNLFLLIYFSIFASRKAKGYNSHSNNFNCIPIFLKWAFHWSTAVIKKPKDKVLKVNESEISLFKKKYF